MGPGAGLGEEVAEGYFTLDETLSRVLKDV